MRRGTSRNTPFTSEYEIPTGNSMMHENIPTLIRASLYPFEVSQSDTGQPNPSNSTLLNLRPTVSIRVYVVVS